MITMIATIQTMIRLATTVQLHHRSMVFVFHRAIEKFDDLEVDRTVEKVVDASKKMVHGLRPRQVSDQVRVV